MPEDEEFDEKDESHPDHSKNKPPIPKSNPADYRPYPVYIPGQEEDNGKNDGGHATKIELLKRLAEQAKQQGIEISPEFKKGLEDELEKDENS